MNNKKHKITSGVFCLITLVLIFSIEQAHSQNSIKNFVKENTIQIKTIDPDSTNYSDLEAIGAAIGDSKIVMLGEQNHGDAATFLAKTRLIKYLHEKKGFNVLAFESDFFALNEGWANVPKNESAIDSFLRGNIFGIWTGCKECHPLLYDYIPSTFQTNNPLQVSGFDCQLYMFYTLKHLIKNLDSLMKSLNLPITSKPNYSSEIFPIIDTFGHIMKQMPDSNFLDKREIYLDTIKIQMAKKLLNNNFWMMVIDNLIQENQLFNDDKNLNKNFRKVLDLRDSQMALNLKWLSEIKYPNEKIIVWAHNAHISKNYPAKGYLNSARTMGTIFTQDSILKKKTYILGFTSREGTAGRINLKEYKIPKPKSNSLESWINTSYNYAFVDFRKYNMHNPDNIEDFYMAGSIVGTHFHNTSKAQWTNIFDGVFYIKDMYRCTKDFSFK